MALTPGILYVTMQPKPSLSPAQFQDWYNNEHGPGRLRLTFCENGFRYRATDLEGPGKGLPEWMAIYDITDMVEMTKETYLRLRRTDVQSQRERDTMAQIAVDRRLYDLVGCRQAKEFERLEEVGAEKEKNVMVAVSITLQPGKEKELDKWYDEEHITMLSKIPGWLRTRLFVTSRVDKREAVEYLALHEYAPKNGLGGEEYTAAIIAPWAKEVSSSVMKEKRRRVYELYYTFGAAPRDLSAISNQDLKSFTSTDGLTKTFPAPPSSSNAIESYITTKDGVNLPFRLEGSPDPNAPCLVLSNSILVTWGIWDSFLSNFTSTAFGSHYRILRYLTRGRSSACGSSPITVDVLSSDIICLLDALRIPRASALIGVSLGGATVLATALRYPERIESFVSCDTSSSSPAGNEKAWSERIVIAEAEGAKSQTTGEGIVGEKLAEMTVRRWFVPTSYDNDATEKEVERVKAMVRDNSLEGFKKSVRALWEYDFRPLMKESKVKGAFFVGSRDGVLPRAMKGMAESYGEKGAEYVVIGGAGHLPMVEKPNEFAEAVIKFLS